MTEQGKSAEEKPSVWVCIYRNGNEIESIHSTENGAKNSQAFYRDGAILIEHWQISSESTISFCLKPDSSFAGDANGYRRALREVLEWAEKNSSNGGTLNFYFADLQYFIDEKLK